MGYHINYVAFIFLGGDILVNAYGNDNDNNNDSNNDSNDSGHSSGRSDHS
ncbi:hypothetical protein [Plasmodium yoelii yoelii]|uniref:Uncharacterized protein n=1 Tax=Plasmodium yoelii yoelii TaxID=73239 RepID=Q7RFW7_PLAYO|nr:hypothetical protein [Plasmodium yoelii yoelii]